MVAEWIGRLRLKTMKCTLYDLEVMGSKYGRVELWVCNASV